MAFVPVLEAVAPFSWFLGAVLAAIVYVTISGRGATDDDVPGESIAVAPETH